MFAKIRAPKADNFRTEGPLIPQWVISKGPSDFNLVPCMEVLVSFTTIPISFVMSSLGILKVKREGTGSSILCPNFSSHSNPVLLGEPPVAIISLSNS